MWFLVVLLLSIMMPVLAVECPSTGTAIKPSPVFPQDNWWNVNVSKAPVDPRSPLFIQFIRPTRKLHPDIGGIDPEDSQRIYGMPYVVVSGGQPKQAVTFEYASESDGNGVPFYPIPTEAITQAYWIEGGYPGNIDQRSNNDRHLLMIDCTNNDLYELYNVHFNTVENKWYAGSGAFFDMDANNRRPDGWTSADAAGLAIFPGLLRYDEVYESAEDIKHALRLTLRSSNGYIYPASHKAGSTPGALPLGARLRLKASVNGKNPALRSTDPYVQKIFRAMQNYGLIFADNGSDMYINGTFDTRWNNDLLNPAFRLLSAADFEVIQLGWNPQATTSASLKSVNIAPASVVGGGSITGTVSLTGAAPASGIVVSLFSNKKLLSVPGGVTIPAGESNASFDAGTAPVSIVSSSTLSAIYSGVTKNTALLLKPPPVLSFIRLTPASVVGGNVVTGTVSLDVPAIADVTVLLDSNSPLASVPANVIIPKGAKSQTFPISTIKPNKNTSVTITSNYRVLKRMVLAIRTQ